MSISYRRVLLLADKHLFKLDTKFKVTAKRIIALHSIRAIHLNKTPDTFVVLKLDEVRHRRLLLKFQ